MPLKAPPATWDHTDEQLRKLHRLLRRHVRLVAQRLGWVRTELVRRGLARPKPKKGVPDAQSA